MKYIIAFNLLFCSLFVNACGNEYFYNGEIELPVKDGFLDYAKFFYKPQTNKPVYRYNEFTPYWFPIMRNENYKAAHTIEIQFEVIKDTLIVLTNTKKEKWKLTNAQLAEASFNKKVDFKLLSDFAWRLAKAGDYKLAENILIKLIKQYPNEYNINANLGTVYELLGNNKLALQYIEKAVAIDPNSHHGSEWIHVNILKKKLFLLKEYWFYDIAGFTNYQYYSLDTSLIRLPKESTQWGNVHRDTLMKHIAYQLHERMFFIGQKDEMMATLLRIFMYGMIHRGDRKYISKVAQLALKYDNYSLNINSVMDALQYVIDNG